MVEVVLRHFNGGLVLRAFGLSGTTTYSQLIRVHAPIIENLILQSGKRFFFSMAYEHLATDELSFLARRKIFQPVGLKNKEIAEPWQGTQEKILFVCPRIKTSPYYENIYATFCKHFGDFNYVIGGVQPIAVIYDSCVKGFMSKEDYHTNMLHSRVMFYHSQEPNHIHYHPFEAIRYGMPLVFMAGGLLDTLGGTDLPGRCKTFKQAHKKIQRILKGDKKLINNICASQKVLLAAMTAESIYTQMQTSIKDMFFDLAAHQAEQALCPLPAKLKRIAVILPIAYGGGSLRGAIELANALFLGSRQSGENAEIVLLHLDDVKLYNDTSLAALEAGITMRSYQWRSLTPDQAINAMCFAGFEDWQPVADNYAIVDDGIAQLCDCDLWLVISDRLEHTLLPIKPIILQVYDYLQRYTHILPRQAETMFLAAARAAQAVLVTTKFTYDAAISYAGISEYKLHKMPMLTPSVQPKKQSVQLQDAAYFIWTTNASLHKNHVVAAKALEIYYGELDGQLDCIVTGVDTDKILDPTLDALRGIEYLQETANILKSNSVLQSKVSFKGNLSDSAYQPWLQSSCFLWHPAKVDNGTFRVLEAAHLGVPSLSSDYPAMQEIDQQFKLNIAWMDSCSPRNMAQQLKFMESNLANRRELLPTKEQLAEHSTAKYAQNYWQAVQSWL